MLTRCFLRLHLLQAKATRDLRIVDGLLEMVLGKRAPCCASGAGPE
jgi:hypothetical protein